MADLIVPTEFPTIQEAVDTANPNDTVLIMPGVYNENVTVLQDDITIKAELLGVRLQGINKEGMGLSVFGNNVTIENIILSNYMIGINASGNSCRISFCICLKNASYGILLSGSNSEIQSCGCNQNGLFGMDIGGDNNKISDNRCLNNMLGSITNSNKPLTDSTIDTNILVDPRIGVNLTLTESTGNKIVKNAITSGTGIYAGAPSTVISENVLQACELSGIQINSENNTITNNFITGTVNGIQVSMDQNCIKYNVLGKCSESGITVVSNDNRIISNIITSSTVGIRNTGKLNVVEDNQFFFNQKNIIDAYKYCM